MNARIHLFSPGLVIVLTTAAFAQPQIVTEPADQTNDLGTTAIFSVVASGAGTMSYQWRDYANLQRFVDIPGATSASLVLENVQFTLHRFGVVVSDTTGSVTSRLAKLVVLAPPSITTQPFSQRGSEGGSVTFSVAASGVAPLAYQWRFRDEALAGATNSSLVLTNLRTAQVGTYAAVVTNRLGSITSAVVGLSLLFRVSPPFDPGLNIVRHSNEVEVSWRGEGELQRSVSPNGPWGSLGSPGGFWTVSVTNTPAFYRLRNPHPRLVDTFLPFTYRPGTRLPMVVALHGYGDTGPGFENYLQLLPLAESRGFIYCYPSATLNSIGISFWDATDACCDFFNSAVDDAAFLRSLIEEVDRDFGVDRKRIFLVGLSNGGFMSYRLACAHADVIAGIVSIAGMTFKNSTDCRPVEPVNILHIHGTADSVVYYSGGRLCSCVTGVPANHPPAPGALESIQLWAAYNGCTAPVSSTSPILDLDTSLPGNDTLVTQYQNHPQGGTVELWSIQGGAHVPSFSTQARASMVDWLLAHPKP